MGETIQDYIAPDGLVALKPGNFHASIHGLDTVDNENGINWLIYYDFVVDEDWSVHIYDTIRRLEELPGLYCAQPGWVENQVSIDVELAIICASAKYDFPFAKDWVNYGEKNRYIYNNGAIPFKWYHFKVWWRMWRQPSMRMVAKVISKDHSPNLIERVLFTLGVIVNALQGWNNGKVNNSSVHDLQWIQLRALDYKRFSPWYIRLAKEFWLKRLMDKTKDKGIGAVIERDVSSIKPLVEKARKVKY